jgi:hypothetical protein
MHAQENLASYTLQLLLNSVYLMSTCGAGAGWEHSQKGGPVRSFVERQAKREQLP